MRMHGEGSSRRAVNREMTESTDTQSLIGEGLTGASAIGAGEQLLATRPSGLKPENLCWRNRKVGGQGTGGHEVKLRGKFGGKGAPHC